MIFKSNYTYGLQVKWFAIFILITLFNIPLSGQPTKKQVQAIRITTPPKIDGVLNDTIWQNVPIATDFYQYEPYNEGFSSQKTEVKFVYDNIALYVGAMLYDTSPDSILKELGMRDENDKNTDMFTVDINPFNNDLFAYSFKLTAAGVQCDEKYSMNGVDINWDAVWESAVKINDKGWAIEMKIPYSALRFPKKDVQVWGLSMWRGVRRKREWSTWTFNDKKISGVFNQAGELVGIEHVTPPFRLSLTPYASGYAEKTPDDAKWGYVSKGGMDLKYGINESFTLDMTLIPDFGQVQSDNIVLNLTPFETYYDEKRPFFTEGTEMFSKCNIFYSRRIGGQPSGYFNPYYNMNATDKIVNNPGETRLINATKLSGRTNKDLGIGFFNAMTSNTYATIADSNGVERKLKTQPFTNYNMFVLDQTLKNNSYISFANTNVLTAEDKYTANVSGTEFKLTNKKNIYAIRGKAVVSQKYDNEAKPVFGHNYYLSIGKTSGNFKYNITQQTISNLFDPNDMGYLQYNNAVNNSASIQYNIYKPFWKIINSYNYFDINYSTLYVPKEFKSLVCNFNTTTTFNNYLTSFINLSYKPIESNDYFEARTPGRVFIRPKYFQFDVFLSPDYRKRFAVNGDIGYVKYGSYLLDDNNIENYWVGINPRLRFNDRMFTIYDFQYSITKNDYGYVYNFADTIYFGKRDLTNITNTLTTTYIFTNKSSLSFRLRHYWNKVIYEKSFYILNEEGYLEASNYKNNHDINFNTFNIDMIYTWNFAPGSEISITWKNNILKSDTTVVDNYFDNLRNTLESPQTNSFSIKFLYYLDYQYLKFFTKKKPVTE